MNPRLETPSELVGDWYFECLSQTDADGYFTILADCRYLSFFKDKEGGAPAKWCPDGYYPARYRLTFTDNQEIYFKSKTMKKGILHTYRFDGPILILDRREPPGSWLCRRILSDDLPQPILARRTTLIESDWGF
jgi:hypothetical protein